MTAIDKKVNFLLRTVNNIYKLKHDRQAQANDVDKIVAKLYDLIYAINIEVNNLNERIIQYKYYEVVPGASSGNSITKPTGSTIELNKFGSSGDAVLSTVDGNNIPTWESPRTSEGTIITTALDTNGTYTFSGVPTESSVAIIYCISISQSDSLVNVNNTYIISETELDTEINFVSIDNSDSPYTASWGEDILIDCTAGQVNINLPSVVNASGKNIWLTKIDSSLNKVTFTANGIETILTNLEQEITEQYTSLTLRSTGTAITLR